MVDGYIVKRYDVATVTQQTILSNCTGTISTTTCVENTPAGQWLYSVTPVFSTNWTGLESLKSSTVTVAVSETTPPVNAISLSVLTGNAAMSGNTIFYRGLAAGSFMVSNALTDTGTGPGSSTTATLTGASAGWTHTPSTVGTPSGGPYLSNAFSWAAGTTSGPSEVVTGHDVAGNTAATTLSVSNDSTAPTPGTITYGAGYQANRSVAVAFSAGTDNGSGVGVRRLQRSYAPLTTGTCGTYSTFRNLGAANPASPYTDSQVTNGICYKYQYVVSDLVGNQDIATSTNVATVDYGGAVNATPGLLSQWRLGEVATSSDSFTGNSADLLTTAHTGETGATWAYEIGSANTEQITDANRLCRSGQGYSVNYTTATPASADYSVEADLVVKSVVAGDMAGVIGRLVTGTNTFYTARWDQANVQWSLAKISNGTVTALASTAVPAGLTAGSTYRIRLSMIGTALKLFVNGVQTVSATDGALTAVGKAGIRDGIAGGTTSKSNTTGIHFDNFQVTPTTFPRAADSKGSNTGDYLNGPTFGATGALAGDANKSPLFDGVNDYVQAVGTTAIPVGASVRSVEMWFKTTSAARQVLFAYGTLATNQEFGLWLNAGGSSMTAWGSAGDKTFALPSAVNNGVWHQVVKTYDGTNITVFIDGVALASQAATRATVMDSYGFSIGAVVNPADATNVGGYFNGSLDEVSFYTTALDQATVTNHYQLGTSPLPDLTGPTGGSVAASGLVGTGSQYASSLALSLNLAQGTDPSGVAATGSQLLRSTATLISGTCGAFGTYTLVTGGTDPSSPTSDTVTDQACYRYQYVVSDLLGNPTTFTSADIKVDTTAPSAPTLSFGTFSNAYSIGSTVFYRSAAATGSFRSTASATDTASGIASYAFPALGTHWTSTPVSTGVNTYAWSVPPAASGTSTVTATNNATKTSAGTSFTLTPDDTGPTVGTVSYLDGSTSSTSVSVSFTAGTDAGSGIGTRLLQRASATLTNGACGAFGGFTTVTNGTNPTSPLANTVTSGNCYQYQYLVSDNVGNAGAVAGSANVVKIDTTGPTGGSVAASGLVGTGSLYSSSTTVTLNLAKGTDPSGVAATGAQLLRARATLFGGTCLTYGTYALVTGGTDPSSPKSDTVTDQACYRYQYVVSDTLGNTTTYTSADIKVDLTAPSAPTLTFSSFSNAYWSSGSTVFYRSAAGTGSFRATASATDSVSGIASYGFPALGSNWTSTPFSTSTNTYGWTVSPAASGTSSVTATNNATGTSAGTPFTLTADDTAPTPGTVSYLNGATSSSSVSVSFTSGTDAGSGVATATRVLQRASAPLTSGVCGTFGAFTTRSTNPTSPYSDSVFTPTCYKYQYVVLDNVGNPDTATSASIAKISSDVTGPTGGSVAASGLVGTGSLYSPSATLSLNLAKGTDTSGIAATGNQLLRATATLTSGTCGTYGTYALVTGGTDPTTPLSDTVADQACYKYHYIVSDSLGNATTNTSADIKVDLTAPAAAPSLTFGTFSNTYWSSGSTVFYRSAAASGSFRATASATDPGSGIASYGFPGLGSGWTSTPVSTGVNTYAWTVPPAASGTSSVTATNNATGTSPGSAFTLTADDTAPTAGTVSYLDGASASNLVNVTFTAGTDAGSGVATGTRVLQRASATLTGSTCGTFGTFTTLATNPASPYVDTVSGACYRYQYVVSDNVGNQDTATSSNVVRGPTYFDVVRGTSGLVSQWRLGDSATASDTFTDTAGVTLQSHTAQTGSPWTKHAASTTDAVITNGNRIRKNGSATFGSLYYSSGIPASADYMVEADAFRASSSVADDIIGIVGRLDTTNALGTYYSAVYDKTNGRWSLISMNNGVKSVLGSYTQTFSSGTTYHLSLDMSGSTIRLLVDGIQRVSATNATITAAGRAGVTMGFGGSNTTVDNSNGMHLDNFTVSGRAADSWGTNHGGYLNGPILGVAGAITGDPNTAVTFDGINDYMSVARQISNDFSIEFWFKSTSGSGTSSGWWQGEGLVDAEGATTAHDFGVSLRSDGKVVAGVGSPAGGSISIVSSTSSYNDGGWHHVVFTRTMSSGAMTLYVDGVSRGGASGSTTSLTSPTSIDFGRVLTGPNYFTGTMDELAVYNTVLSAATVTAHYNAG
jgi:hypothetical protein